MAGDGVDDMGARGMGRRGILAALSYMACAVLLVMFNKAALSTYSFPCANVITLLQIICSICLLYTLRYWNLITFENEPLEIILGKEGSTSKRLLVPMRTFKRTLPLSFSYLMYMVIGMASLRGVSVPMYTTLRRTTVLFTMAMEYAIMGQRHSREVICSVGVIVFGAFLAGARDFSFDTAGYSLVVISNVTTAIYLAVIARLGKVTGLNSFGLMWCNSLVCLPILLVWTWLTGELHSATDFPALYEHGFQAVLLLSCILAFVLNYTIFLNTSLNSPLTQTMCGNIKDLGTIFLGWLLFGGLPFDWLNVLGQALGFLGSGFYAYCKLHGK
ncbi:nucleotide-sugar uncharacterized transporter 3 isoform X2 [Selaginella moellendorffii]|nr:nucleotide-sugar uncharacterized transporter 3 isoform X2 [Selaginella moellendorffii]|eukprot:XP_002988815.2 nucleotide-sugar uncharacterized transporter 3 isoform X2 [Selaginella moellendorffii]